jgi:hypothetical protein
VGLIRRRPAPETVERSDEISFDQWVQFFSYLGNTYGAQVNGSSALGSNEKIAANFSGFANQGYKGNGVVFSCIAWRMRVASEARFTYQRLVDGRPSDLFGTNDLRILEQPWPGATTGDLLSRVVLDIDLAGNSYTLGRNGRLRRLRPDWTTIVSGSRGDPDSDGWDLNAELLGYLYQPGGPGGGRDPVVLGPDEVAHVAPYPDPLSPTRGVSWLHPILVELDADTAASIHKLKFFQNGATIAQTVVLEGIDDPEVFQKWIDTFNAAHQGVANAYKTLFLTAGAKPYPVGSNFEQMAFKATQGAGETRIAAAAGIHPVVLGLSEGLQGSALNAGNYATARRSTADGCLRPLWRNIAGSFQRIVTTPGNARLWTDDRDVAFLREDQKDAAEIQQMHASTIETLVRAGFTPEAAVKAVTAGDLKLLQGQHTGLFSVQLQEPGAKEPEPKTEPNANEPSPNGQQKEEVPA